MINRQYNYLRMFFLRVRKEKTSFNKNNKKVLLIIKIACRFFFSVLSVLSVISNIIVVVVVVVLLTLKEIYKVKN